MADKNLIKYLKKFLTDNRINLFEKTINERTRYITVALEDIYQPHNASAVLRTCDCFGVQDIHIIENKNKYEVNPDVALGSSKWITLNYHNKNENNTIAAINHLKEKGYRIVATTPHTNDVNLEDFDISKGPIALFFGTELKGLSEDVLNNCDEYLKIPMYGFTESFNISVSAAIILHTLTNKLRKSDIPYHIKNEEIDDILYKWITNTIKKPELIIKKYYEDIERSV